MLLMASFVLFGCAGDDKSNQGSFELMVQTVDADGAPYAVSSLTWRDNADDQKYKTLICEEDDGCAQWTIKIPKEGTYLISASHGVQEGPCWIMYSGDQYFLIEQGIDELTLLISYDSETCR